MQLQELRVLMRLYVNACETNLYMLHTLPQNFTHVTKYLHQVLSSGVNRCDDTTLVDQHQYICYHHCHQYHSRYLHHFHCCNGICDCLSACTCRVGGAHAGNLSGHVWWRVHMEGALVLLICLDAQGLPLQLVSLLMSVTI